MLTRGNLVNVIRYKTDDADNLGGTAVESKLAYNIAGSVTLTRDMSWHQTSISYADSFSDGNNSRNTFAYPTTVTDEDGFQSLAKYNFDYGATTWTQTPSPNSDQTAPTQSFTYDYAAQLRQVTSGVNGAYKRYSRIKLAALIKASRLVMATADFGVADLPAELVGAVIRGLDATS